MTREEKINTLKAIIQECEEYQWQRKGTLFEIIKDLEQEPCEDWRDVPSDEMNIEQAKQAVRDLRKFIVDNHISPKLQYCEDAISRLAVLEIQAKYAEYVGVTKFWQMRDDIKALPPVTPKLKTGRKV